MAHNSSSPPTDPTERCEPPSHTSDVPERPQSLVPPAVPQIDEEQAVPVPVPRPNPVDMMDNADGGYEGSPVDHD